MLNQELVKVCKDWIEAVTAIIAAAVADVGFAFCCHFSLGSSCARARRQQEFFS